MKLKPTQDPSMGCKESVKSWSKIIKEHTPVIVPPAGTDEYVRASQVQLGNSAVIDVGCGVLLGTFDASLSSRAQPHSKVRANAVATPDAHAGV